MKIKQTLTTITIILGISCGIGLGATNFVEAARCAGVDTAVVSCSDTADNTDLKQNGTWQVLLIALNILSACVGVAAVGGMVYGGILYASAGGNPEQTKKALTIITNVVIGIVLYILMYAILNYLTPGGLFNG